VFQTTITEATIQNLAVGGASTRQSATLKVGAYDQAGLVQAVKGSGVPEESIAALETALIEDKAEHGSSMGQKVKT
jgi:hypothetical protein